VPVGSLIGSLPFFKKEREEIMKALMIITYFTVSAYGVHKMPPTTQVVTMKECQAMAKRLADDAIKGETPAFVKCVPMGDK